MHKPRVIPLILLKDGLVVQSIGFEKFLPIGKPTVAVEFFSKWDVDEIILLDINASDARRKWDASLIDRVSRFSLLPLTVGGGIQTEDDVCRILAAGADKVAINRMALTRPDFISECAERFGNQCVVVSMDVQKDDAGNYLVRGATPALDPVSWAQTLQSLGAGEILVQAVHKDGLKTGYDIDLIEKIVAAVSVPVIVAGGAGTAEHLGEGLAAGASGVCAGNMFQFTEHSTLYAKGFLSQKKGAIRLATPVTYRNTRFDALGRPQKKPDEVLESYFHSYVTEEND
jgi:cyclase